MMFNDFSNGLSETRDAIANGYFWDSEAVEPRLNQGVRLAKYNKVREWNTYSSGSQKTIGISMFGQGINLDYFVFTRNGAFYRYDVSNPTNYLGHVGNFPSGKNYTDYVETPRGVYVFGEATASGTSNTCYVYYVAKSFSPRETLAYGLTLTDPERITFTNNNLGNNNYYGQKYATLLDNQALMWAARSADGKTSIYLKDYEDLIPLTSSAVTPIDYLP